MSDKKKSGGAGLETIPLGYHFAAQWKTIRRWNPKAAFEFAGWAVAYALAGEVPPPGNDFEEAWDETTRESDGLKATRAARQYAIACRWADEHGEPRPPRPSTIQKPIQTPIQNGFKTDTDGDEYGDEEKTESKTDFELGRSGFALKACPADEERMRLLASDAAAVEGALAFNGETDSARARGGLRKMLRKLGRAAFVEELLTFQAEIRAGEKVDNRGAAFNARLKQAAGLDAKPAAVATPPHASPSPEVAPPVAMPTDADGDGADESLDELPPLLPANIVADARATKQKKGGAA